MENKKIILNYFIVGLIILVVAFLGVSYAYWNVTLSQGKENIVQSACLEVSMEQEGTPISLGTTFPIEDIEGEQLQPFQFTIHNKCDDNANYQINLESLGKNKEQEIAVNDRLKADYIRFKLNETTNKENEVKLLLSNTTKVKETLKDAYESHKLMTGYLKPSEAKTFELRLWMDSKTLATDETMSKTFLSKITITTTYLENDKIPPTANLELAVCNNTITANGSGNVNENKRISKYEYKLDEGNWENANSTKEYTDLNAGMHYVSLRVTDSSGLVSEEIMRDVEIQEPEKVTIKGKEIPLTTCGSGLYKVEHNVSTIDKGWNKVEYRYAGDAPNNYVKYNDEKWRIVGLVNVKTQEGNIEQRLKLVNDSYLYIIDGSGVPWDYGEEYGFTSTTDFTKSYIKELLNGIYYNSEEGLCYGFSFSESYFLESGTCDFTQNGYHDKGLGTSAQNMIDKDVVWSLGSPESLSLTVSQFYEAERGVRSDGKPSEWSKSDDDFNGVGLLYPSDFAYANSKRELLEKKFDDSAWYYEGREGYFISSAWTMTTTSTNIYYLSDYFYIDSIDDYTDYGGIQVKPAIYLKSDINIISGEGTSSDPYILSES